MRTATLGIKNLGVKKHGIVTPMGWDESSCF